MTKKVIVIDGKGHMMGRLASYVAKQLLNGKRLVIQGRKSWSSDVKESTSQDRFSEIKPSSTNSWEKDCWLTPVELSSTTEHHPECSGEQSEEWSIIKMQEEPPLWVHFLINAGRLKVIEGCPAPYDTMKRQVIPDALRCVKLSSFRKYCVLGDLASQVGWNNGKLINEL